MARILAIDFDRVIHDIDHPVSGRRMGAPLPGAAEALRYLHSRGDKLIVHTLWATTPAGAAAVRQWLEYWKFPPVTDVTNSKPKADAYIDDKAIRHVDWVQTLRALNNIPAGRSSGTEVNKD